MKEFFQYLVSSRQFAVGSFWSAVCSGRFSVGNGQFSAGRVFIKALKELLPAYCSLICYLLLCCQLSNAQIYPVQVTPQLIPPYSFKLSDYTTTTQEKLFVNLLLTDAREFGRQVRLKMFVEGPGIKFQSVDFVSGALPIVLDGGINQRLTNLDLQSYFNLNNLVGITPQQYARQLPEGQYRFCFEVYDQFSGQRISNRSCANIFLVLNDPPLLNVPFRGDLVTARDPQNVIFNWTPRHISAGAVQYEFTLKELWDTGMDPQAAFMASPPLYQTTTFANTLHYGPAQMPLLEGKTYGWQVRAFVSDGITETSLFRNNGLSEVYHFAYRADCHPPRFVLSEAQNSQTVTINWQMGDHVRYRVQYRKKGSGDSDWFGQWSQGNEATVRNLEAGTTYEFRVGGDCIPLSVSPGGREESGEGLAFSPIHEFTTPTEDEMAYYNCGIPPEIEIGNQEPLQQLQPYEVFTAGDFPVVVREASGSNGYFSGWGYITLPFLEQFKEVIDAANIATGGEVNLGKFSRVRVEFDNIKINTDYKLVEGMVETSYDPDWSGVVDVDQAIEDIGQFLSELFSKKEELLEQLSEAESFEEQQSIISQINDLEVTIDQQIDQIEGKENLPQDLQDELESLKQEGDIVANSTLTPQEIESISNADAKRRERIREIDAIAGEEFVIFGDKMIHHIMAIVNGYWCAKNEGGLNFEYFYGKGWSFFDFKGNLDDLGLKNLVVKFKKKNENHGKKLVATEYAQGTTKVFEGKELEYEGFSLTFNTTDLITQGSNSLQLCFKSAEDRSTFVNTFLASPPTGNALYYTNLTRELNTKMASKKYDDAHLLLTMIPKCEIEAFTTAQRLPLINSLVDESTTDGLQEQLIIRLLEEYEDVNILEQANLYRQLDLESLFESVDGAESDLLTFTINDMVERYRAVAEVPYGGTVAMQEISTGNIFTRYNISKNTEGAIKLTLDTNAAGYNTSYQNSEEVVPYTDIFSIFTVEGEALEIPYLLLLKGVVKKEEERNFRQMMVAVDVASLAFGIGELKLAFTATSNLARAFRIALGSADIMATAADVACNGEDNELCQDWQKVSGWVQLGLISATGADLLYQTLKRSTKLQDEVLRLGGGGIAEGLDDLVAWAGQNGLNYLTRAELDDILKFVDNNIDFAKRIALSTKEIQPANTLTELANKLNLSTNPTNKTLSPYQVRVWYSWRKAKIGDMLDKAQILEYQAKQAVNMRNEIRSSARQVMKDTDIADFLDTNELNKTWEQLVQEKIDKGYTGDDIYEEIISSSMKGRPIIDNIYKIPTAK